MSAVNPVARWFIIALIVAVSACGGGGGGDSPAPVQSKVFAADEVNGGVGSTENANPTPGSTIAITRIIAGSNTQIPQVGGCFGCLPSLALDNARDQLYVSTNGNILVFNNAGTATGNIAPSRVIGGGAGHGRPSVGQVADGVRHRRRPVRKQQPLLTKVNRANSFQPVERIT